MKMTKAIFKKFSSYFSKFNFFRKKEKPNPFLKSYLSTDLISEGKIQVGKKLAEELTPISSETTKIPPQVSQQPAKQELADFLIAGTSKAPFSKPNRENLLDPLTPEQIRSRSDLKLQKQILREQKKNLQPAKKYSEEIVEKLNLANERREQIEKKAKENDLMKAALREKQNEEKRQEVLNEPSEEAKAIMLIKKLFPTKNKLTEYEILGLSQEDPIKLGYKFNQWLEDRLGDSKLSDLRKADILCKEEFFYESNSSRNTYNIIDLVYEKINTKEGQEALGQLLLVYITYLENHPQDVKVEKKLYSIYDKITSDKDPIFLAELALFTDIRQTDLKNAFQKNMYDLEKPEDIEMLNRKKEILIANGIPKSKIDERLREISTEEETKSKNITPREAILQDSSSISAEKKPTTLAPQSDNRGPHQKLLDHLKNIPLNEWSKTNDIDKQIDQIIKTPNDYKIYPKNIFKELAELSQRLPIFTERIIPGPGREEFLGKVLDFKSIYKINSFDLFELDKSDIKSCKIISRDFQDKIEGLLILGYKPEEIKKHVEKNFDIFKSQSNENARSPKKAIEAINDLIVKKASFIEKTKLPVEPKFKPNISPSKPQTTPNRSKPQENFLG